MRRHGPPRALPRTPPPGAVLDGRDVGTVVCPNATAKLFVTASPEVRAQRRLLELQQQAPPLVPPPTFEGVLKAMKERDERDASRAAAPLAAAPDALVLDTSALSIEAALAAALEFVRGKVAAGGASAGKS
jgi:cytidylate kinase